MSEPITAVKSHDVNAKLYYSVDWTSWLRATDTVASCAVSVVEGTATVATTPGGVGASSVAATVNGATTTTAVVSATAGRVGLQWRVTSAAGEVDDRTSYLQVTSR